MFPERFSHVPAYAFPRLRALVEGVAPAPELSDDIITMTIGEPRHVFPDFVSEVLAQNLAGFNRYPVNEGTIELRSAISGWLKRRYGVDVDAETQVMALNGTREGLYNAAMALCPETKNGKRPIVLTPNPFYPVYMIAAISVQADPIFVPATAESGHLPDYTALSPEILDQVAMAYICSPANPQGAIADEAYWATLFDLAEKHDFKILADECYSEIYRRTPPPGALEVAVARGVDPERVVVFHSLSKRSNLPGLRSGFVASGPESIRRIKQLRSYAGAPMPMPLQAVSEVAWSEEAHVVANRALYNEKFDAAAEIFADVDGYVTPEGGFFLWLPVEDGEAATLKALTEAGVRVLPGEYLSRPSGDINPGKTFIRAALVAPKEECTRGLIRLRDVLYKT